MVVQINDVGMVVVEELRIGNYLHSLDDKVVQINTCHFIEIRLENLAYRCQYKAIPLTEEMLLKCGFERIICRNNSFYLSIEDLAIFVNLDCNILEIGDGVINDFKYLHQLQNLYFALTGQELEIKL